MAERTVSVRLRAEVSQYMNAMRSAGKATDDLEKASFDLSRAMDAEEDAAGRVRVAEQNLASTRTNLKKRTLEQVAAEERLATARRAYAAAQEKTRLAAARYSTIVQQANDDTHEHGAALRDVEKIAARTQFQFRALAVAIAAASPAASALIAGAAATAAGGAFIAMGALALKSNSDVRNSFADLAYEVRTGVAADAAPLADAYVGAADKMGVAFQGLRPQMRAAFEGSVPLVDSLTDGVIAFAENAMPGLVTSVQRAGPAVDGFASLLGSTGSGLGGLLEELSEHSEEAGQGFEHLGSLIEGTLVETGGLLGHLTDLWAEHGDEMSDVIVRIIGILSDLTGSALPVLSTAAGTALNVLSGLLSAIEPMTSVLGPAIAMWLSLAGALKVVSGVQNVASRLTSSVDAFGRSIDKNGGKARAFGVAAAAVVLSLGSIALEAQRIHPNVEALGEAMLEWADSGRAGGEATRVFGDGLSDMSYAIGALNDGGLSRATAEVAEFVGGLVGLEGPLTEAKEQMAGLDDALVLVAQNQGLEEASSVIRKMAEDTGYSVEEITAALPKYSAAVEDIKAKQAELGTTAMQSRPGIKALEEALTTLGDKTADTADKVDALNEAWRQLFGVSLTLEEAQAAFEEGLDSIAESLEQAKAAGEGWQAQLLNANGTINLTTEAGRALSEGLIQQGEDYRGLAQTAYDSALKQGQSQQQATQAAITAVNQRRAQFIAEMRQMGFTEDQARRLADRYLGMPRHVLTQILAPGLSAAIQAAYRLTSAYDRIPRHIQTVIETVAIGPFGMAMAGARVLGGGYADGGLVKPRGYADGGHIRGYATGGAFQLDPVGLLSGPGGPRSDSILARVSNGEFVSTGASTDRNLAALEAGNRGARLIAVSNTGAPIAGYANGGMIGAAQAILKRIESGGFLYEDLSWKGNPPVVREWNDRLIERLQKQLGPGNWYREDIAKALRGMVSSAVRAEDGSLVPASFYDRPARPIQAGTLVKSPPRPSSSSGGSSDGAIVIQASFPRYVGTRSELVRELRKTIHDQFGGNVDKALGS